MRRLLGLERGGVGRLGWGERAGVGWVRPVLGGRLPWAVEAYDQENDRGGEAEDDQ
jgi:hypothetical protein